MSKHTRGPWTLWLDPAAGDFVVSDVPMERGGYFVICSRGEIEHRAAESSANARLIAAAPELLALLRESLQFVGAIYREHGRDYLPNSGDTQDRIQALLARINGDGK